MGLQQDDLSILLQTFRSSDRLWHPQFSGAITFVSLRLTVVFWLVEAQRRWRFDASPDNLRGLVEEDPVAKFVVLPNYNEDEPMFRDTLRTGADVYLLPKQLDEQVAKLQFRALWEHELVALGRTQVEVFVFKRSCGLVKRGRDLLQRAFSFSDAHAVSNGISSLLTVRLCRLQAYKNDVYIMPKKPTLCPHSSLSVSTQVSLLLLTFMAYTSSSSASQTWLLRRTVEETALAMTLQRQLDLLRCGHELRPAGVHGWLQVAAIETAV